MTKKPDTDPPLDAGIFLKRERRPRFTAIELVASVLSVLWLGAVVLFVFSGQDGEVRLDPTRFVITLIAVLLPVAIIWVAAIAARTARVMREEARRLQAAIDALRHSYVVQAQSGQTNPALERRLAEMTEAQRRLEATIEALKQRNEPLEREEAPAFLPSKGPAAAPLDQPSLGLEPPESSPPPPLTIEEVIRAANFPRDEKDSEGFATLRKALKDPQMARFLRAAQDMLTLLSQDGIYTDDLRPIHAPVETWRRFAKGERGKAVAELAGIRDRSALALARGRMKKDPVFRDAALHFLRQFEITFTAWAKNASDADIAAFADTRSARAFMLIAWLAGIFDERAAALPSSREGEE